MREYLMQRARAGGFQVVDMQPPFIAAHTRTHQIFEYPEDGHWNGLGHGIAAAELEKTTAFTALTGSPGAASCSSPTH
jgi:hypothetical protein